MVFFLFGAAFWFLGGLMIWLMLAKHGGLDRQRTLAVLFGPHSPFRQPRFRKDRVSLLLGAALIGIGMLSLFTGIGIMDGQANSLCRRECAAAGKRGGRVKPAPPPGQSPQESLKSCWCVDAEGNDVRLPLAGLIPETERGTKGSGTR